MTTQLTDAQRAVLAPACEREDRCIYPITAPLRGGAVGNVCKSLLTRGLIEAVPATDAHTVWSHTEDGTPLTLAATAEGRRALGGGPAEEVAEGVGESAIGHPQREFDQSRNPAAKPASRQGLLLTLLRSPEGATIAQMTEATGWQPHSVRGALSGVIGKKLGLTVVSEKAPERGRVYRLG